MRGKAYQGYAVRLLTNADQCRQGGRLRRYCPSHRRKKNGNKTGQHDQHGCDSI